MRIGPHATVPLRSQFGQLRDQAPALVEQFFWFVALHPFLKNLHVLRVLGHFSHRHLVGAEGPFYGVAIDDFWSSPALGCTEDDHRPARTFPETVCSRVLLDLRDRG